MAAGVGDEDGMLGGGAVEVFASGLMAESNFIVSGATDEDPLWSYGGFSFQKVDEAGHGAHGIEFEVGVGLVPGIDRKGMLMDIVEARYDRRAVEVRHYCIWTDILADEAGIARCDDEVAADGDCLGAVAGRL